MGPWAAALIAGALALGAATTGSSPASPAEAPNVVVVTIDTLRDDRMSVYGYERETSPNMDRLIAGGVRFAEARTVEPLTSPALCSMLTSLYPHEHGSSRNGLRMRKDLTSLPRVLADEGYQTAAFVGNWTLRNKLSGLGEHFEEYGEILTKKRWFGLIKGEATAVDLTGKALAWLSGHMEANPEQPFFLWVHYTEPHAPYLMHDQYAERLGLNAPTEKKKKKKKATASDRYDTEIAYVDHWIGELVRGIREQVPAEGTLLVLASDHGESLGEHKYWGHGRNLHEPSLRIPMAMVWPGTLEPRVVDSPALNIDIAPTVTGLLGIAPPPSFQGHDWTEVFEGGSAPRERVTQYQAHRGAVLTGHDSDLARRAGLLEVALLRGGTKEIWRVKGGGHKTFDLRADPAELTDISEREGRPTDALKSWYSMVENGLHDLDEDLPDPLDEESIERLRALGYAD